MGPDQPTGPVNRCPARLLPDLSGDRERGFDLPGLLVLGAALGLLVVPLVLGHELGRPLRGWVMLGRLLGDGSGVGAAPLLLTAVLGLLAGCAYAPLFGRALARVAPADAADASGLVVTAVQLGQVLGIALLGSVFLGAVDVPTSARGAGHALLVTAVAIGGVVALAAGLAVRAGREDRREGLGEELGEGRREGLREAGEEG
ncbi:hypothetical protein [Kitasatospora purpeofusca]|uniref:hypothetical protein n=1 Tax=Kitasatospora purpeofusca TaxID=67352 RepID=UPI003867D290|nr:hypothetical protein OIP63_25700 [Kitasatospora purpeofusca]